jgi:hypothetical protein
MPVASLTSAPQAFLHKHLIEVVQAKAEVEANNSQGISNLAPPDESCLADKMHASLCPVPVLSELLREMLL